MDLVKLEGLYAISDESLTPYESILDKLEIAFNAGIKIFQFRDKTHSDFELKQLCQKLQAICQKNNVLFVINDRLELAKEINADALHIGSEDIALLEAKKVFQGKIGVSCYNDLNLALNAQENGADYVAFGAFFDSPTKKNAKKASLEILTQAKEKLQIPICTIGGITYENIHLLKDADMVAIISGLWKGDIQKNIKKILERWKGKPLPNAEFKA